MARQNETIVLSRSTKDVRRSWIENGCPIRPTDEHVVVVRLNEKDTAGKTSLEIVTSRGRQQQASALKWYEIVGQVVAVGPGPRSTHPPHERIPIEGVKVGDYIGTMNDLGGLFFQDFQETGADVIVIPVEACRCIVEMPGQP